MVRFITDGQDTFRVLKETEDGVWVIRYDNPNTPFILSWPAMSTQMQDVEIPDDFLDESEFSPHIRKALEKRMKLIAPLIEDEECITNNKKRVAKVVEIAKSCDYNRDTLDKWYFRYLAMGRVGVAPTPRHRVTNAVPPEDKENFKKAINQFYYSSKKRSLKTTYEMMLLHFYRDENQMIKERRPTYNQFLYYYKSHKDSIRKLISRKGIGEFQKNARPLTGSGDDGIDFVGCYEIDATIADIYIVSRYDRKPIGRPIFYCAIDVATRLIAGIHICLEENSEAVLACLYNAARDKVEYCHELGISIQPEQWPSSGMPKMICTDRGTDFIGSRTIELCGTFDIEITNLPAYRPDLKGYVEKAIGCVQDKFKPLLRGKGVVEKTPLERGIPDYAAQAVLDIDEFTRVVIQCVLFYNTHHLLEGYVRSPEMKQDDVAPIACNLWKWFCKNGYGRLIQASEDDLRLILLPRDTGTVTRYGIEYNHLYYTNNTLKGEFAKAGLEGTKQVTVAYDPNDTAILYLVENGQYLRLSLSLRSKKMNHLSQYEARRVRDAERENLNALKEQEILGSVECLAKIEEIINGTSGANVTEKQDTKSKVMKQRRGKEKNNEQ